MTLGRPGETLGGRYVLQALLGAGAYGEVWRARDTHRSHNVALKLLTNGDLIGAWREASILTALHSPYILEVHNADRFENVPYLDTALARTSLDKEVKYGMEPHRSVEAIRRTLRGLQLCHTRGLLHRDVKPANVFESFHGDVLLGDFGIAALVNERGEAPILCSPHIRAPETFDSGLSTVASDIYAAGVTLYFLLAGRWPFDHAENAELERAIRSGEGPALRDVAPHVSAALSRLVSQSMDLEPARRFVSASAFDTALGRLPASVNQITPMAPHEGHDSCWNVAGRRTRIVCVSGLEAVSVEVRYAESGRRVNALCTKLTRNRLLPHLRKLFNALRQT